MKQKLQKGEQRSLEQIRQHYEIEKELANKLRFASKAERRVLYSSLYDELFRRVPLHPLLTRKLSPAETTRTVSSQLRFLKAFLNGDITFLEVGPGDCALSFELTRFVKQVYAVDVSDEITKASKIPKNFKLILSDGCSIPVPANSINVAYSNQLMEHLHPDDALEQLRHIYNVLVPGGTYICVTPNRLYGPADVSKYFDVTATGFHLKEYTTFELSNLFKQVGFSRVRAYLGARGKYASLPVYPIAFCEMLLDKLPYALQKTIARTLPLRLVLGIALVGVK
jgi:SAM-dependent methyltransferase